MRYESNTVLAPELNTVVAQELSSLDFGEEPVTESRAIAKHGSSLANLQVRKGGFSTPAWLPRRGPRFARA
jgi:hypothetical protein